jgi:2,3-dihydroxy-p-cumate/2,3-dihydroxybenzoate 3,4-dioxygenase
MELVDGLGYVSLTVPDLDLSLDFYRRVAHLKVSERGQKTAFLTGGDDHHWLRLDETGAAGLSRFSFQLTGREAMDEVTRRLDERQTPWKEVKDLVGDRLTDAIRFTDPGGYEVELFTDMVTLPVPVRPFLGMERVLHAVWSTPDMLESRAFYADVLGFKDSDFIEQRMVFMRAGNGYHHTIGISQSQPNAGRFDHFCILVNDLDDVLRARNVAQLSGATFREDLVRHAASGSVSTYIMDPINAIAVEFCFNHRQIDDEGYRARVLPAAPATFNLWNVAPDYDSDLRIVPRSTDG